MDKLLKRLIIPEEISIICVFVIGLACLVIMLVKVFKTPSHKTKVMTFYVTLILLQLSFHYYNLFWKYEQHTNHTLSIYPRPNIENIAAYVLVVFEYSILAWLIASFLKSKIIRKYLFLSTILFAIIAVINWIAIKDVLRALSIITTVEAIPLIIASLYFFYEVLKAPPTFQLHKEQSFWIVTGILSLFICILPLYSPFEYLRNMRDLQLLDSMGYAIIIILFAKASLCEQSVENILNPTPKLEKAFK